MQVNRDLEAFIEDARKAAAAHSPTGSEDGDVSSLERIVMIAERCLDEDVATFRDSIQTIVDQVEVSWGTHGQAAGASRQWSTVGQEGWFELRLDCMFVAWS